MLLCPRLSHLRRKAASEQKKASTVRQVPSATLPFTSTLRCSQSFPLSHFLALLGSRDWHLALGH